jgi:hypothetical protein
MLGIIHGHYGIGGEVTRIDGDVIGRERSVKTGIGIVCPAADILQTLNQPELVNTRSEMRRAIEQQDR